MGIVEFLLERKRYKNKKTAYKHLLDGPENDPEAISMLEFLEKEREKNQDDLDEDS